MSTKLVTDISSQKESQSEPYNIEVLGYSFYWKELICIVFCIIVYIIMIVIAIILIVTFTKKYDSYIKVPVEKNGFQYNYILNNEKLSSTKLPSVDSDGKLYYFIDPSNLDTIVGNKENSFDGNFAGGVIILLTLVGMPLIVTFVMLINKLVEKILNIKEP